MGSVFAECLQAETEWSVLDVAIIIVMLMATIGRGN